MRFSQLLQLVTLSTALLFARSSLASSDDPDVTVLTDSNFDDFINQDLALVEFYAPWCGHCKSLAPEYALAATDLKSNDPPIALGKVDATEQQALSGKFDVKGYPTLKVFRNGKPTDYNGPRKRDGIVAYMKKQGGPAAKPISSKAEAEAVYKQDPVASYAVIGVFGDGDKSKPSQLSSSFTLLANRLRDDFFFGKIVGNSALAKELYNIDGEGIVAVLQGEPRVYSGDSKQSNVEQFIRANSVPLIGQLTAGTQDTYTKRNLPIVKLFMKVDKAGLQSKQMKYYINRLKKVAEKYSEQLSFVIADKGEHQSHMTSVYNAQPSDQYLLVVDDITKGKQYKFDDNTSKFDAKAYGQFIDDFVAGKLSAYVKSEAEPADNNGPVKVLTGKNFESLVTDDKDVFLEFYAPWCGHCKTLAPKYEELGKKLADQQDVVIAKLDATANDFPRPPYEVAGYPTLYFKPAGGSPMKYEGGREVTDMLKFVKKNGTKYVGGKSKTKKGVSDDEKEL